MCRLTLKRRRFSSSLFPSVRGWASRVSAGEPPPSPLTPSRLRQSASPQREEGPARLIEGSLYTSEGLLLFHTVNTAITSIFPSYFVVLKPLGSPFLRIVSVSAAVQNQDVFSDFTSTATTQPPPEEQRRSLRGAGSHQCLDVRACELESVLQWLCISKSGSCAQFYLLHKESFVSLFLFCSLFF